MNEEKLERICFNCNNFFPISMDEPAEFGICLNDEVFEPFIDELLENSNYDCCNNLIDHKKFPGGQDACQFFSEIERMYIDDDSELGREIIRLIKNDQLNRETFMVNLKDK